MIKNLKAQRERGRERELLVSKIFEKYPTAFLDSNVYSELYTKEISISFLTKHES